MKRPRLKRALHFFILALLMLIAAEGLSLVALHALGGSLAQARAARAAVGAAHNPEAPTRTPDYVLHPYAGYAMNTDRGIESTNEFGLFGTAPTVTRAPGRVIVGVTGGSVAGYFGVRGRELLGPLLARSPKFRGKELVFLNLALPAYHQPQQLTLLAYLLAAGTELDVLIELDGFNEVALYAAGRETMGSPLFPDGWAALASRDPEVQLALGETRYLWKLRRDWAARMSRAPLRWSVTATLIWWLRDGAWQRALAADRDDIARRTANPPRAHSVRGPEYHPADEAQLYRDLVAQWKRSEILLDGLCRTKGIRYLSLLQPNQYVPGSKPMDAEERAIALNDASPSKRPTELGYPLLVREGADLARHGIEFHDLSLVFKDERAPVYRDDCCHLNPHGNELLARAIAAAITGEPQR